MIRGVNMDILSTLCARYHPAGGALPFGLVSIFLGREGDEKRLGLRWQRREGLEMACELKATVGRK